MTVTSWSVNLSTENSDREAIREYAAMAVMAPDGRSTS